MCTHAHTHTHTCLSAGILVESLNSIPVRQSSHFWDLMLITQQRDALGSPWEFSLLKALVISLYENVQSLYWVQLINPQRQFCAFQSDLVKIPITEYLGLLINHGIEKIPRQTTRPFTIYLPDITKCF